MCKKRLCGSPLSGRRTLRRDGVHMYNPQLETFLCVAECKSFNKAAQMLYISPPAVIKQINLLEDKLGLQLFVRTHRGLELTDAGKSLAQDLSLIHI